MRLPDRLKIFSVKKSLPALVAVMACAASALAAPDHLPAIVQPAGNERHAGKVIFVELITPDLAAARQFYAGLFGWTFKDIQYNGRQYAEAFLDGHPVAGLMQRKLPAGKPRQPVWRSFFSVPDVDLAIKNATEIGAKVLFGPRDIPDRGREAVLADPQGAVFAVLSSASGDPPDELAAPGEWIWSSLLATDADNAAAFYQNLFGYDVFDLPAKGNGTHLLLASKNYARASVNSFPANKPGLRPHWLNFVRVEDTEKTAAKVAALGGRVLVKPHADRQGGKVAVVADPQGARFGLIEWSGVRNKEAGK